MCFAPRKFACLLSRRFLAPLLTVAYVTTMIGAPWPTSSAPSGATPYPCQGHRCGCVSAQQCWSHCCCFTPQQRLAWAQANHVEPPAELVAAIADHGETDHDEDGHEHQSADEHSHSAAQPAAHSCCHKNAGSCARPASPAPRQAKKTDGDGFQAFKCHGIATLWVTSGAVAPTVSPAAWTFDWSVVGTIPTLRYSLSAVPSLPAVPPPRLVACLALSAAV